MASFDTRTGKVTLSGSEMLQMAKFLLDVIGDSDLEDSYSEIDWKFDVGDDGGVAYLEITRRNAKNFTPRYITFEIHSVYPES